MLINKGDSSKSDSNTSDHASQGTRAQRRSSSKGTFATTMSVRTPTPPTTTNSTPDVSPNRPSRQDIRGASSSNSESNMEGNSNTGPVASGSKTASPTGNLIRSGKEKEQRVPLACLRCRAKRARCSGVRPRCKSCEVADADCQWPEGRRRKRTRREMEEAERMEREATATGVAALNIGQHPSSSPQRSQLLQPRALLQSQSLPSHNSSGEPYIAGPHRMHQPYMDYNGNVFPRSQTSLSMPYHIAPHPMEVKQEWDYSAPPLQVPYVWPSPPNLHDPSSRASADSASSLAERGGPLVFGNDQESAAPFIPSAGMPLMANDEHVMRALQMQTAFVNGNPASNEELELYYYRFSGTTAIRPGIHRIAFKLKPRTSATAAGAVSAPVPSDRGTPMESWPPDDIFDNNNIPLESVYRPLLDLFFKTMSQHFPSISRRRMEERLETGTMSAFMLNCICAVAARFHPSAQGRSFEACAPFITKAQELLLPLLQLPATDTVTGLLLLAWASYGQNAESSFWQYSGMAFRMSFEMGLHEVSEIYESRGHVMRSRLLFWSLFITDRIISYATGRPHSIPEEAIEIPLPSDEDFYPDPARNTDPASAQEPVEPVAFQFLARAMVLCGRVATILNRRKHKPRTLLGPTEPSPHVLNRLQAQLIQFYNSIPDSMKWNMENFRRHDRRGHGGTFVTFHSWVNGVLSLMYNPKPMRGLHGAESPIFDAIQRSSYLSYERSRSICEFLVIADLFPSQVYLGSPFMLQAIFGAVLTLSQEFEENSFRGASPALPPDSRDVHHEEFSLAIARQNINVLAKAIQRMERYWAGVAEVLHTLEVYSADVKDLHVNFESNPVETFISLPDVGLLKRYTAPDLPHNATPATDTSLQRSIEKEEQEAARCPMNVPELLASYSIEGFNVSPANQLDVNRLLGTHSLSPEVRLSAES